MKGNNPSYQSILVIVLGALLLAGTVHAGTNDLDAGKRQIYQDDTVQSMRDMYIKREGETKEYKDKILASNEESVALLREIRDLLKQLNANE